MFEGKNAQWEMFVQQALELFSSSRVDLKLLEQHGGAVNPQVLDRLVRTFHSVGGVSQHFKLPEISQLLERMEGILSHWKEQPALIELSSVAAIQSAFDRLRQSLINNVPRSDLSLLQQQAEILQEILNDVEWLVRQDDSGVTQPFSLYDYPEGVAAAVIEGRSVFAIRLRLPRNKSEKQRTLENFREQLMPVGDLLASVPPIGDHFELDKIATTSYVWLLFSSVLQQDLLVGLTQLPAENVILLPIPSEMREAQVVQPRTFVDDAMTESSRLPGKDMTDLVLRMRQANREAVVSIPDDYYDEQSFEERLEEMELLAMQIRQANYIDTPFSAMLRPVLGITVGVAATVLLVLLLNRFDVVKIYLPGVFSADKVDVAQTSVGVRALPTQSSIQADDQGVVGAEKSAPPDDLALTAMMPAPSAPAASPASQSAVAKPVIESKVVPPAVVVETHVTPQPAPTAQAVAVPKLAPNSGVVASSVPITPAPLAPKVAATALAETKVVPPAVVVETHVTPQTTKPIEVVPAAPKAAPHEDSGVIAAPVAPAAPVVPMPATKPVVEAKSVPSKVEVEPRAVSPKAVVDSTKILAELKAAELKVAESKSVLPTAPVTTPAPKAVLPKHQQAVPSVPHETVAATVVPSVVSPGPVGTRAVVAMKVGTSAAKLPPPLEQKAEQRAVIASTQAVVSAPPVASAQGQDGKQSPPVEGSQAKIGALVRDTTTPFVAITPPSNAPQGGIHYTRHHDGGVGFSIATMLNHVASRPGETLTIQPDTLSDIKLVLKNPRKKAVVFDFDATGQVTVSPAAWRAFVRGGGGIVTVSYVYDKKNDALMIRDVAALTTFVRHRAAQPLSRQASMGDTVRLPGYPLPVGGWFGAGVLEWMQFVEDVQQ